MPPEIGFEPGVETLEQISRGGDPRIREVAKHIVQSVLNKRHRSFEVLKSHGCTGQGLYEGSVRPEPLAVDTEKDVPFFERSDLA